jgi:hypothetical protein
MNCELCGAPVNGLKGRAQHNRYHHPDLAKPGADASGVGRGRPPGVKDGMAFCKLCGRGYGSAKSLDYHGYEKHKPEGHRRADWQGPTPPPQPKTFNDPLPQAETRRNEPGVPAGVAAAGSSFVHRLHRIYPARDDRGNAEKLVDLPWITWPATEAACEDALNQIAKALEHANEALPFWSSLRAYVAALMKRLGQRPEGPPPQQMHAHSSPKQALKAKQVA